MEQSSALCERSRCGNTNDTMSLDGVSNFLHEQKTNEAHRSQPGEPFLRTLAMLCIAALLLLYALLSTASRGKTDHSQKDHQVSSSQTLPSADFAEDTSTWQRYAEQLLRDPHNESARLGLQELYYHYVARANQASAAGDTMLQDQHLELAMNLLEGRLPVTYPSASKNPKYAPAW